MFIKAFAIALVVAAMSTAAGADVYRFTATGRVGTPYSVDRHFNPVSTFPTSINAGDSFSISFDVDPARYTVTSLYDPDPTVNIYYGTVSSYRMSIGSYVSEVAGDIRFSSSQLWNDFISGGRPVDYFGISTLQAISASSAPIALTSSVINETFGFDAFDWTATARQSDLMSEITSLDRFVSRSAYVGFIDPNTYDQTVYSIDGLKATLAPVPEPETWLLMIVGFGAVGFSVRRKRRATMHASYVAQEPLFH